jgi:hypothetical protein
LSWLERIRAGGDETHEEEDRKTASDERTSPGLASIFESLSADGRHAILDLGSAESRRLQLLGRFARRIRFAELVPEPPRGSDLDAALDRLGPDGRWRYDVVLSWDLLDSLDEQERSRTMRRIEEVTGPGALIFAVVDSGQSVSRRPIRHRLVELDRVAVEPAGPPQPAGAPILPRQVERLLAPFEVEVAVSLRAGFREYVARRPEDG